MRYPPGISSSFSSRVLYHQVDFPLLHVPLVHSSTYLLGIFCATVNNNNNYLYNLAAKPDVLITALITASAARAPQGFTTCVAVGIASLLFPVVSAFSCQSFEQNGDQLPTKRFGDTDSALEGLKL